MVWHVPLFKIYSDDDDVNTVANTIRAGMYWAEGPDIKKFEKMITNYVGTGYCVVFNSGTSALHAALLAHDIKQGDEVIVPSFTFISTANAPLFVGAKPVFADIEETTLGLDPGDVNEKITSKTKAIIPIHYGGSPCNIKELKEVAEDHNLALIEDAAESFGAKIGDKNVGTFGDSAMFSFCQNKVITTGEGGAIVTDSRSMYEKLKLIRSHGRDTSNYFSSTEPANYIQSGYNFRMSNITAALGVAQMRKLNKIIKMRRENAEYLTAKLNQVVKEIVTPNSPDDYYHVYQMYTTKICERRDLLAKYLFDRGIMTKVYFSPVHLTHFYKNELGYICELPVTEDMSNRVLTLPMYPTLSREEMDYIVGMIKMFFEVI